MLPQIVLGQLKGKKFYSFFQRLGFFLPSINREHVIWCHAVSVGEVKALGSFFSLLKKKYPQSQIVITTVTKTGHDEAKKTLIGADYYLYFPLDLSFSMNRFVSKIQPDLFFLSEGDVWPNCLRILKKQGTKIFLISGKMSERSFSRWQKVSFFSEFVFSHFDLICVQNDEFLNRFRKLFSKEKRLFVTGNLKLDYVPKIGVKLPCCSEDIYITVSCTHRDEEKQIIQAIIGLPYKIFLAPRHPERFAEVASILKSLDISFVKISQNPKTFSDVKVILIDCMGMLNSCYENSAVAILGGSFVNGIGGHNILEPLYHGCVSLFGPYVYSQKQLAELVLASNFGHQTNILDLSKDVSFWVRNSKALTLQMREFTQSLQGGSEKTFQIISRYLQKK